MSAGKFEKSCGISMNHDFWNISSTGAKFLGVYYKLLTGNIDIDIQAQRRHPTTIVLQPAKLNVLFLELLEMDKGISIEW